MIEQREVDGVPVLFRNGTGPTRAGLAFRVGMVDEPLTRRGITHLVEHLSLHSAGVADYHYNGATGVEFTYFHMQGSEEEVASFLSGVCASLRDLPMHRLAMEKDLLRAEANGRGGRVAGDLPMWRHGARDYGMPSYPEFGLPVITADELRAWVAHFFTKQNAVLWVSGERLPAGLKLDLPDGTRRPLPAPSSAIPVTPAFFGGPPGVLVWDALVPRGVAASVFADVLERAMRRELRQEGGLSYTVKTDYETLGAERAVVTAVADALPEKQGALVGAFTDVLAAMRVGRVDQADVAAVVKHQIESLEEAGGRGTALPGQALNLLAGAPVFDEAEMIAETRTVTAADVAAVAAEAAGSGLLQTPGSGAEWAGYTAAPDTSATAIGGTGYPALDGTPDRVVIGPAGISRFSPARPGSEAGAVATVRFDACSIVLAWPDGGRQFIGHDAIVVGFEPSMYAGGYQVLPWLDAHIPPALRVDQPARDPDSIPRPRLAAVPQRTPVRRRAGVIAGLVALVAVTLLNLVILYGGTLMVAAEGVDDLATTVELFVVCTVLIVVASWGIYRCIRYLSRK